MKRNTKSKILVKQRQNRNFRNNLIKGKRKTKIVGLERLICNTLSTLFSFVTLTRVMILITMVAAVLVSHTRKAYVSA
jgi:hypothetical protein